LDTRIIRLDLIDYVITRVVIYWSEKGRVSRIIEAEVHM